jgi:hypothetical protein
MAAHPTQVAIEASVSRDARMAYAISEGSRLAPP